VLNLDGVPSAMGYSDQGNQRFCKLLNPKLFSARVRECRKLGI